MFSSKLLALVQWKGELRPSWALNTCTILERIGSNYTFVIDVGNDSLEQNNTDVRFSVIWMGQPQLCHDHECPRNSGHPHSSFVFGFTTGQFGVFVSSRLCQEFFHGARFHFECNLCCSSVRKVIIQRLAYACAPPIDSKHSRLDDLTHVISAGNAPEDTGLRRLGHQRERACRLLCRPPPIVFNLGKPQHGRPDCDLLYEHLAQLTFPFSLRHCFHENAEKVENAEEVLSEAAEFAAPAPSIRYM